MGESPFPFILGGGIFRAVPWLRDEMLRRLPLAIPATAPRDSSIVNRPPVPCRSRSRKRKAAREFRGISRSDVERPVRRVHCASPTMPPARGLADRVAQALQANPRLVLGLPTGRTPVAFYHELSHRVSNADWLTCRR